MVIIFYPLNTHYGEINFEIRVNFKMTNANRIWDGTIFFLRIFWRQMIQSFSNFNILHTGNVRVCQGIHNGISVWIFTFTYFGMPWNEWRLNRDYANGLTRVLFFGLLPPISEWLKGMFSIFSLLNYCYLLGYKAGTLIKRLDLIQSFFQFSILYDRLLVCFVMKCWSAVLSFDVLECHYTNSVEIKVNQMV